MTRVADFSQANTILFSYILFDYGSLFVHNNFVCVQIVLYAYKMFCILTKYCIHIKPMR